MPRCGVCSSLGVCLFCKLSDDAIDHFCDSGIDCRTDSFAHSKVCRADSVEDESLGKLPERTTQIEDLRQRERVGRSTWRRRQSLGVGVDSQDLASRNSTGGVNEDGAAAGGQESEKLTDLGS